MDCLMLAKKLIANQIRFADENAQSVDMEIEDLEVRLANGSDLHRRERDEIDSRLSVLTLRSFYCRGRSESISKAMEIVESALVARASEERRTSSDVLEAIEWAREAGWSPDEEEGVRT